MELSAELESGDLSHVQRLMDFVPFPCLALDCQEVIKENNKWTEGGTFRPFSYLEPFMLIAGFRGSGERPLS